MPGLDIVNTVIINILAVVINNNIKCINVNSQNVITIHNINLRVSKNVYETLSSYVFYNYNNNHY